MPTLTTHELAPSGAPSAMREAVGALIELHRALIAEAFHEHEKANEVRLAPLERLHLATTSPSFAWLRPMSELIVEIDELLDEPLPEISELHALRAEIDELTSVSEDDPTWIGSRVRRSVDTNVAVASAYASLERALARVALEEVRPTWIARPDSPDGDGTPQA